MNSWLWTRRHDLVARALLTAGALLPYWRFLSFRVLFVTDDFVTSDIFNGELPVRVLIGRLLRSGELPAWTSQLCSGLPLAGVPLDPLGSLAFSALPTAAALDLVVLAAVLIAAHGAYAFARRLGADRAGAVLAGLAFAGSGYMATQLKHLGIISTVAWLPAGLSLIDRALEGGAGDVGGPVRWRRLAAPLFGLVFANQVLCGFPQSAYICAITYAGFAAFRAAERWVDDRKLPYAAMLSLAAAALGGALAGAVVLLPLSALAGISSRADAFGYERVTEFAYWPPNIVNFFVPYLLGDVSNGTYAGPSFFWEDYGYAGLAPVLLAIYAVVRARRTRTVLFLTVASVFAFLMVLGRSTAVFDVAYHVLPGLGTFRFQTRFLVLVELGIALLGAIGLSRLRSDLEHRRPGTAVPGMVVVVICALTALDLFVHQPRQNPVVPAARWLAPPASVARINGDGGAPRTYTLRQWDVHLRAFREARGWTDVEPYFEMRSLLQPNTGGGYWGVPSADCYSGLAPSWYVHAWEKLVLDLTRADFEQSRVEVHPALANVLRAFGVTHVLSRYEQRGGEFPLLAAGDDTFIYRVENGVRARVVPAARRVASDEEAAERMSESGFDPTAEVLLHDLPAGMVAAPSVATAAADAAAAARVTVDTSRTVTVEVRAASDGFLVLADTFYPGWHASVDGVRAPIYRANLSLRAVPVTAGHHVVEFTFEPPRLRQGAAISALTCTGLVGWMLMAFTRRSQPARGEASRRS